MQGDRTSFFGDANMLWGMVFSVVVERKRRKGEGGGRGRGRGRT